MLALVKAGLAGAVTGAVFLGLFFLLNYWSLGRGGEARIAAAFDRGSLSIADHPRGDTVKGYNQFNDCLILGMAVDQRYSRAELTVSPSRPFGRGSADLCSQLRSGEPASTRYFYHNYVHGHTMLVRYLLPVLPVDKIRELYRIAISFTLALGVALAMMRIAQGRFTRENAVFLVSLLVIARFFGLESFGQSLSHGASDLVFTSFLLALTIFAGSLRPSLLLVIAAALGALTMIFEFLTGGLPLGLAAVIGLSWFALQPEMREVRQVLVAAVAFSSAAIATLLLKFAAVAFVFGADAFSRVRGAMAVRVSGEVPDYAPEKHLIGAIFNGMESMIPGMGFMASAFLLLALGFGAWSVYRHPAPEMKLLAASTLPVILWPLVFHQHMIEHAWFMDRIFAWIIVAGFTAFVLAATRRDRPRLVS